MSKLKTFPSKQIALKRVNGITPERLKKRITRLLFSLCSGGGYHRLLPNISTLLSKANVRWVGRETTVKNLFVWSHVIPRMGLFSFRLSKDLDIFSNRYCEQPGKCQCRFGWTGLNCDYCMTIPGCSHGFCTKPMECKCEEGWTGMFCSIRKSYESIIL